MKTGSGHAKGAAWEREVCKQLSLWITNGAKQDVFWRSAMSGGRSTVLAKRGIKAGAHAGDITAISAEGHQLTGAFFVECKFYRELSLSAFLLGFNRGALQKFWDVAVREAASYDKEPLLIAKQNNVPPIVLLRSSGRGVRINDKPLSSQPPVLRTRGGVELFWYADIFRINRPKPKLKR